MKGLRPETGAGSQAKGASRVLSLIVRGLEAAALKSWINPGGSVRPQSDFCREQRVDLEVAQLPALVTELRERSLRGPSELEPQLLVRQQAADDSFNRSMCHGNTPLSRMTNASLAHSACASFRRPPEPPTGVRPAGSAQDLQLLKGHCSPRAQADAARW